MCLHFTSLLFDFILHLFFVKMPFFRNQMQVPDWNFNEFIIE